MAAGDRDARAGRRPRYTGVGRLLRAAAHLLLGGTVVAAIIFASIQCDSLRRDPPARKNVLLITLDALRQDHLSAFGYGRETSPNIDRLASAGVALRDVIPSGCSTKASLTSLFTSLDFRSHRIIERDAALGDEYVTLAEVFRNAGYQTAGFVATPHLRAELNYGQGFDVYEDFRDDPGYVGADVVAQRVVSFLRDRASAPPFFAYVHFLEPHPPWQHGSPWAVLEEPADQFFPCTHLPTAAELAAVAPAQRANLIAKYDGAIRYADEWIGAIVAALRDSGALPRTIIGISTDHGIELLERYSATHGYNPFDEVVRGFLVLFDGGGAIEHGALDGIQARIFDIGPTLLGLAGVDPPTGAEGIDLLRHADRLPALAFTKCYIGEVARRLNHKLVRIEIPAGINPPLGLREGFMLFDLRADPGETVDVKSRDKDRFDDLRAEIERYRRDVAPVPSEAGAAAPTGSVSENLRERLRALGYAP